MTLYLVCVCDPILPLFMVPNVRVVNVVLCTCFRLLL